MEAFWDYPFWQTLSLNGYDQFGHILRLGLTLNKCSPYANKAPQTAAERQLFRDCNQWLGPNQPGITTPDFTASTAAAARASQAGKPAKRIGERRGAGQPDAGPLPGQPDISKPQVVLPPQVKKLLDKLGAPQARAPGAGSPLGGLLGGSGDSGSRSDGQLLDFLLGP
jgi:hypothetical protein